ncbi:MAG: hypothetical protein ACRD4B_03020 [Acidobacteriota bacterium]
MSEWQFIDSDQAEELAELHFFSVKKGDVEFVITVKEYAQRNPQHMRFFAQADKQVNQKTAAFFPFGWGETLIQALTECIKSIRKYPL